MACVSITALPRACGSEGIVAGLEKMYMISYSDYASHTLATNGIVSAMTLDADKTFVEIGLLRSSSGLNETLTKNLENGQSFLTQTMTLVLADLTVENKNWIESIMNQPVAVLIKTRTGKYFAAGLSGQFELSGLEGGTGLKEGDLMGYTLTFSGIDTKLIPQVDSTIVADLIA